jgi:hypothetical protein
MLIEGNVWKPEVAGGAVQPQAPTDDATRLQHESHLPSNYLKSDADHYRFLRIISGTSLFIGER